MQLQLLHLTKHMQNNTNVREGLSKPVLTEFRTFLLKSMGLNNQFKETEQWSELLSQNKTVLSLNFVGNWDFSVQLL